MEASVLKICRPRNIGEANITLFIGETLSYALELDTNKKPLTPCHPGKARLLLKQGKAAVFRRFLFVIILKEEAVDPELLRPGSKLVSL